MSKNKKTHHCVTGQYLSPVSSNPQPNLSITHVQKTTVPPQHPPKPNLSIIHLQSTIVLPQYPIKPKLSIWQVETTTVPPQPGLQKSKIVWYPACFCLTQCNWKVLVFFLIIIAGWRVVERCIIVRSFQRNMVLLRALGRACRFNQDCLTKDLIV